ncbi:MAG: MaoC/PaaZ C-terminal domain-containing protein [Steroidobacteraceae bacterium]
MIEIQIGDTGPAFEVGPLTRTDFVRYAGASGDFNPIHHDDTFAQSAGLPSAMAHGMLPAGILASFVTRWFGAGSVRRLQVRFSEPVWPGDTLRAEGRVVRLCDKAAGGMVELVLSLRRDGGTIVVAGSAAVILGARTEVSVR